MKQGVAAGHMSERQTYFASQKYRVQSQSQFFILGLISCLFLSESIIVSLCDALPVICYLLMLSQLSIAMLPFNITQQCHGQLLIDLL